MAVKPHQFKHHEMVLVHVDDILLTKGNAKPIANRLANGRTGPVSQSKHRQASAGCWVVQRQLSGLVRVGRWCCEAHIGR
jgi:hypothetical protein